MLAFNKLMELKGKAKAALSVTKRRMESSEKFIEDILPEQYWSMRKYRKYDALLVDIETCTAAYFRKLNNIMERVKNEFEE
jgi:hypothetical protein